MLFRSRGIPENQPRWKRGVSRVEESLSEALGKIYVEKHFPPENKARMEKLVAEREATQPVKSKTGGSTFKNPPGHKAWQLIDQAGCRGLTHGGAQVSEKHCNFLINTGDATGADIEALGEDVRARVRAKFGVELEWEIKRVGRSA